MIHGEATVAGLLAHPALAGAVILAGGSGTGRAVSWLARLRSPEDALAIGAGDLVLAEGDAASVLGDRRCVARLAERGVPAIACPWSPERDERLDALLLEADEAGLPFVRLPRDAGYRELSTAIASARADAATRASEAVGASRSSARGLLAELARGNGEQLERACLGHALAGERDWPEIRAAVEAYLRHGGNAIAAGAELGIHRHTVRARVRRYEAISGLCLDEPDSRLVVALAFRLAERLP